MPRKALDEWGADKLELSSSHQVVGEVIFVHLTAVGIVRPPARHYVELVEETPTGQVLWRVFCDLRQLGMTDSVLTAIKSRERQAAGRLIISSRELLEARRNGRAPTVPFTAVAIRPEVPHPGMPCKVIAAPGGSKLAGHRVLVVDRDYRAKEQSA